MDGTTEAGSLSPTRGEWEVVASDPSSPSPASSTLEEQEAGQCKGDKTEHESSSFENLEHAVLSFSLPADGSGDGTLEVPGLLPDVGQQTIEIDNLELHGVSNALSPAGGLIVDVADGSSVDVADGSSDEGVTSNLILEQQSNTVEGVESGMGDGAALQQSRSSNFGNNGTTIDVDESYGSVTNSSPGLLTWDRVYLSTQKRFARLSLVWLRTHFGQCLSCVRHTWAFLLLGVASATMGLLILGRSWQRLHNKNRQLQNQLLAKDKKISELTVQLTYIKESMMKNKRIPVTWAKTSLKVW